MFATRNDKDACHNAYKCNKIDECKSGGTIRYVGVVSKSSIFRKLASGQGFYLNMTIFTVLIGFLVMIVLVLVWFGSYYYSNSCMQQPDGIAKVTGPCGDTMEIALKFDGLRVVDFYYWTDGCSISKMCAGTAVLLSRGKTVEEIKKINSEAIAEKLGNLPDTHVHCAVLAEMTLQKALDNYLDGQRFATNQS